MKKEKKKLFKNKKKKRKSGESRWEEINPGATLSE